MRGGGDVVGGMVVMLGGGAVKAPGGGIMAAGGGGTRSGGTTMEPLPLITGAPPSQSHGAVVGVWEVRRKRLNQPPLAHSFS
jgi:hypothetical protein